jgi:bifunctional non-homologous end joining protein LigD
VISKWEQAGPEGLRPMLATAGTLPVRDAGWAYEMKWDGIRALALIEDGAVRLTSRTGRDISYVYPELADGPGAAMDHAPMVLDGEIVAFGASEWPHFETLQQRMNISSAAQARILASQVPVSFLAFDVLWLDDKPLVDETYARRRELLDGLGLAGRWQAPPSFIGERGADVQAVSKEHSLEGIMAKRLQSRYEPGRRSQSWLKIKNIRRQEVVIGGWKPGEGARAGHIGSLIVGVYEQGELVYSGHVGTGFTQQTLQMLAAKLKPLKRATSPFGSTIPPEDSRYAQWVEPVLVAEVAFGSWTTSGRLRAPAYKGLRDDKDAAEVRRES